MAVIAFVAGALFTKRSGPLGREVAAREAGNVGNRDGQQKGEANSPGPEAATLRALNDRGVDPDAPVSKRWSPQDKELIWRGRRNLPDAIRYIESNYASADRDAALLFLVGQISKSDLHVVPEIIGLIKSEHDQRIAQDVVARHWATRDPGALREFVLALPDGKLRREFSLKAVGLLASTGQFEDAARLVEAMPYSKTRSAALESIAEKLARIDTENAVAWSKQLATKEDQTKALRAVYGGVITSKDPKRLLAFLPHAEAEFRPDIIRALGVILGARGVNAVEEAGLAGHEREMLLAAMARSLPAEDLPGLMAEVKTFGNPEAASALIANYVSRSFDVDRDRVIQWTLSADSAFRPAAMRALISTWFDNDSGALSEWVNTLPRGSNRDTALAGMAKKLRRSDRNLALQVANTIDDADLKANVLREVR